MKKQKNTMFASMVSLVVATSCCWLSSLVIWFGGTVFLTTIASRIESFQLFFFIVGAVLGIISLVLYWKLK